MIRKISSLFPKGTALYLLFGLAALSPLVVNQITAYSKVGVYNELESMRHEMTFIQQQLDDLKNQKKAVEKKYQDDIGRLENKINDLTDQLVNKRQKIKAISSETTKTVYLTFDDGPSSVTLDILDILKEESIKATFFVNGSETETARTAYRRIVQEGHVIANHTYSHDYKYIYQSKENFYMDILKLEALVEETTTTLPPKLYRFPGGSNISRSSPELLEEIKELLSSKGYIYFDWNCCGDDSIGPEKTSQEIYNRVVETGLDRDRLLVLLHMNKRNAETAKALPEIISYYREKGYSFEVLHQNSYICQFNN